MIAAVIQTEFMQVSLSKLLIIVLVLSLCVALARERLRNRERLIVSTQGYTWRLNDSEIYDCPTWHPSMESPPLEISEALTRARNDLASDPESADLSWRLEAISVISIDLSRPPETSNDWAYEIWFDGLYATHLGPSVKSVLLVTMDGTVHRSNASIRVAD